MSVNAYVPYAPLNELKAVAEDIWIVDGPEIGLAFMGLRVPFPTRMTVVRLPGERLWIHSPISPTEDLVRQVEEIGDVQHLIAPNSLHYWWIPEWSEHFPSAVIHGVSGLERSAKRDLPPFERLEDAPPAAWDGVIDQIVVRGDLLTEADFFHRPSRSLVLTDLIENFEAWRVRNRWLRWLLRRSGSLDPDGKAPIDMQLSFLRQRQCVRSAVKAMIDWNPKQIIIAHGRWYPDNGVCELRRSFRWVL